MTFDENKVDAFEKSPCGLIGIWPLRPVPDEFRGAPGEPGGYYASRGNCTAPNECTCWCKAKYIENICMRKGGIGIFGPWTAHRECRGPFQDLLGKGPAFAVMDMVNYRNLLDPDEMFGTRSCRRGFEGTVNETFLSVSSLRVDGVHMFVRAGMIGICRVTCSSKSPRASRRGR